MYLNEKYISIGYTLGRSNWILPFKISPLNSRDGIDGESYNLNNGLSPSDSLSLLIGWILSMKMKSNKRTNE